MVSKEGFKCEDDRSFFFFFGNIKKFATASFYKWKKKNTKRSIVTRILNLI